MQLITRKQRRRTGLGVAVVTALATLSLAATAGAAAPQQVSFSNDWTGDQTCSDFTISYYGHLDFSGTIWSDAQGEPVRALFHRTGFEVNTNDATGVSVTVKHEDTIAVDFVAGTARKVGASQIGTRPGQGIGMHESGLQIEDFDGNILRIAGPHDNPDIAFCELLG